MTARAEHVGSLLRPPYLLEAREAYAAGQLDSATFKSTEDRAVRDVLALQEERLREAVHRAAELPFWRAKLDAAGLAPDDVKTTEDLLRVPRTVKDELRADQAANPPFGSYQSREGAIRIGTTTGTTGTVGAAGGKTRLIGHGLRADGAVEADPSKA